MPLVIALLLGGGSFGGAFYAVSSGLVPPPLTMILGPSEPKHPWEDWKSPTFLVLEPIVVPLGPEASARHLRATLALEIDPEAEGQVAEAIPRIIDVLNIYLRTIDERDFILPGMLLRIRAQMLQVVQSVSPPESVHGVLLQEFLLD